MKKSLFLLGTLPVALLTATFAINSTDNTEASYEKRTASNIAQPANGAQGMFEYFDMLKEGMTPEIYQRLKEEIAAMPHDRSTVTWNEHGPDNVGGRTRAILVDKNDVNVVYAGSVSGGLFKSINRANVWNYVPEFDANLSISSMCQTANGTILIATGHEAEGYNGTFEAGVPQGAGLFELQSDGSFDLISGTENLGWINEIVCDTLSNKIWMATESGLRTYDVVSDNLVDVSSNVDAGSFAITALDISPDGELLVCAKNSNSTFVSQNGGASFFEASAAGSGNINKSSVGRQEYSISDRKEAGKYFIYSSQASNSGGGYLRGVWKSDDNGNLGSWVEIAPANNQVPGAFAPFTTGNQGQGGYNNIICAAYQNPKKVFLGGLDVYSWATTGNWSQLSQWFLPVQSPQYLHADNHEIIFDQWGRMYVGSDGGVHFSDDGGQTFHQANRGYNTVQFYNMGVTAHGDVMGGAQDNGCWVNYHDNSTWREFDDVLGGDGFSVEMSFINRNIVFGSSQYGNVARSGDRGTNMSSFLPSEIASSINCSVGVSGGALPPCAGFFTKFALWENPNDVNSTDSVDFVPSAAFLANEVVPVPSFTSQTNIPFTIPFDIEFEDTVNYNSGLTTLDTVITTLSMLEYNLTYNNYAFILGGHPISAGDSIDLIDLGDTVEVVSYTTVPHYYATNPNRPGKVLDLGNDSVAFAISWDTLKVQDPYQSWFAYFADGDVWLTRNALRFAAPSNEWFKAVDGGATGLGFVTAMDFSQDGDNLFIGNNAGKIFRLSGIGNVYSPKKDDNIVTGAVADTLIDWDAGHYATTLTDLGDAGSIITDFAFTDDPNFIMVTRGSASGTSNTKVQYDATNALGASLTFTSIGGGLPSNLPIYCGVVDRDDDNIILVGTELGVFVSTNGGSTWENCSGGFGSTPVMDMKQNWRTFNEGCFRPGEIYIGTFGRGIWSTEAYLGTSTPQDNLDANKFIPNINVYPNPVNDFGTIAFNLEQTSDVTVQIFNLTGQLVQEIKENNMFAGANNIAFTANELPKGTYIIRLNAGDMVETSKFIKH